MRSIVLIAHNIRSAHNVGSLFRTAEGLGVKQLYLTGYTPYPLQDNDSRLPHVYNKLTKQINKTALGAEKSLKWTHNKDIKDLISSLRQQQYTICGLEQSQGAQSLVTYQPAKKLAIIIGNEANGLEDRVLDATDIVIEIPMMGSKESFNVVQATAMAVYHCQFYPFGREQLAAGYSTGSDI